jgi:cytochrome P450
VALLSCHPDAQAKVAGEASTPNTHSNTPNPKSASLAADRPFTRATLLESIRLWPTTPAILRELNQDTTLDGQLLSKGSGIKIFTPFFHRDTETLQFANSLAPEQWLDKHDEVDLVKGLVPFSAGPAICPAHHLVRWWRGWWWAGLLGKGRLGW